MNTPDRTRAHDAGNTPDRVPPAADLLAAYELGLLDADSAARVERALADDPTLLEDLYAGAPAAAALREEPARWSRHLATPDGAAVASEGFLAAWQRRFASLAAVLVPVAAACLLVLAVRVQPPSPAVTSLAQPEPLPYAAMAVRGHGDPADSLFAAGMDAYRSGRYGRAAALLKRAVAAAPAGWDRADQAALYRGVALLLAGHPGQARHVLADAARSPLAPVAQRARWYLAQAALEQGDAAAARTELERLRSSPVYGERAAALLARLP